MQPSPYLPRNAKKGNQTRRPQRACHVLRVERARQRLRPALHSVFATSCAFNVPASASARPKSACIVCHVLRPVCNLQLRFKMPASASARPKSALVVCHVPCSLPPSAKCSAKVSSFIIVAYAQNEFATSCALNVPASGSAHLSAQKQESGPRAVASFGRDMQGVEDMSPGAWPHFWPTPCISTFKALRFKCFNRLEAP